MNPLIGSGRIKGGNMKGNEFRDLDVRDLTFKVSKGQEDRALSGGC